jgi:peptidoglycan/LPS O-acetylase OafA/YrhL
MGWTDADARPLNAAALLAWIFPLSDPPSNDWAVPIAGILWYIRTYLWLVILTPALWAGFRRWPLLTTLLPLALIPLAPHVGFSSWMSDVLLQIGTYGSCWMLGFWHATGRLKSARPAIAFPVAAACIGAALTWMHYVPNPEGHIQSNPVAQVMWCLAFVIVLMRVEPTMAWLEKIRLARLVDRVNSRAVTIYLWHQVAILTSTAVVARAGLYAYDDNVVLAIRFLIIGLLVAGVCWLLGWVEETAKPQTAAQAGATGGKHNIELVSALHPKPSPDQTLIISMPPIPVPVPQPAAPRGAVYASRGA